MSQFKNLEENLEKLSKELKSFKKESGWFLQKVGMVRFNPFSEVGSDQSFSVALLNGQDDGVVITSLYTREENRVYGKPIKGGISEYSLSNEEKEAIQIAKYGKNNSKSGDKATSGGNSGSY